MTPAEVSFNNGDEFFVKEHQEYQNIINEIKAAGYTIDELSLLRGHYKEQSVEFQEEYKRINKEIRIAESLIREQEETIVSDKNIEVSKKQPKR